MQAEHHHEDSVFCLAARRTGLSTEKLGQLDRAGERKTCWAKPPFVPQWLWALNGVWIFCRCIRRSIPNSGFKARTTRQSGLCDHHRSPNLAVWRGSRGHPDGCRQHKRPHSRPSGQFVFMLLGAADTGSLMYPGTGWLNLWPDPDAVDHHLVPRKYGREGILAKTLPVSASKRSR